MPTRSRECQGVACPLALSTSAADWATEGLSDISCEGGVGSCLGSALARQMLQSGGTAASALQRWGIPARAWSEVLVVLVAEPIALLVAKLAFRTIVVRASKFVDKHDARRRLLGDDVGGVQDLVVKAAGAARAHVAPPQEIHL